METVDLVRVPVGVMQIFDDMLFVQSRLKVEEMLDQSLRQLAIRLKTEILAEEAVCGSKRITFTYEVPILPPSMVHAFPELANLPTETRTETRDISIKKQILYPEARINIPDLGRDRIRFIVEEEDDYASNYQYRLPRSPNPDGQ